MTPKRPGRWRVTGGWDPILDVLLVAVYAAILVILVASVVVVYAR